MQEYGSILPPDLIRFGHPTRTRFISSHQNNSHYKKKHNLDAIQGDSPLTPPRMMPIDWKGKFIAEVQNHRGIWKSYEWQPEDMNLVSITKSNYPSESIFPFGRPSDG